MLTEHRLPSSPAERLHGNGAAVISGDSMQPTVQHGETIAIAVTEFAADDDVVIVRVGADVLCKRIEYRHDGVILKSDNPKCPAMQCVYEDFIVIGRAVKTVFIISSFLL